MVVFIVSFVAGILTVLAPCVLPLLPVVLGGSVAEVGNKKRPFIIIGSLAVSVFIFTLLLKGSTALLGASPSFWSYISAVILTAFGLTLIFPEAWARIVLKIPGHNKPDRWMAAGYGNKSSFWTDVIVGAALGPVFTTCSPTFFVILATVLPESLSMGIIDLLAFIVGMSISLLIIAFVGQKVINKLGWATDPNGWFRKILGILFIILALAIVMGWDKELEASILNSGFFDVTTLEQSIHQDLQGQTRLPEQSGNSNSNNLNQPSNQISSGPSGTGSPINKPNPHLPYSDSSNTNGTNTSPVSASNLPPPPAEQDEGRYVEIQDPAGFVNTPGGAPITIGQFIGKKVVLIDFIDYSCINCERTFPYLENWWNKYDDQGLEVIAIHTPEFAFEKNIANVQAAAKQFGLTFPIVLDNDYATWNAYGNEYWPHKYLIDIHGNVVYDKIGEGGDDDVESEIVNLLQQRLTYLGLPGAINTGTSTMSDYTVNTESPETYFGAMRNDYFGNGTPEQAGTGSYAIPASLTPDQFYLGGKWDIENEYAQELGSASTDALNTQASSIAYEFAATNVNLVAASADGSPVTAQVLIDGKSIPNTWAGKDVTNGILTITGSRLYDLYDNPTLGQHRIDIIFQKPGAQVYTFTFG